MGGQCEELFFGRDCVFMGGGGGGGVRYLSTKESQQEDTYSRTQSGASIAIGCQASVASYL